jgi:T5SS/PEP-CTERM-associated repeat protein
MSHRITGALVIALICSATPAGGDPIDSFWIDPNVGSFFDPENWDGPVPDGSVTAVFDIEPADTIIGVSFVAQDAISDRLILKTTAVELRLYNLAEGEHRVYDSINPAILTPAVVVGESNGDDAHLTVEGGMLRAPFMVIGQGPGSSGTVALQEISYLAASLESEFLLHVGGEGVGALEIPARGRVDAGTCAIGASVGAEGFVTVEGDDAELVTSSLSVGKQGEGTMTVTDLGRVTTAGSIIGQQTDGVGSVTVRDGGSFWHIQGPLDVGQEGRGTLTVLDGAAVLTEGFATIGTLPESNFPPKTGGVGDVTVSGPATFWVVAEDLHASYQWMGTLDVLDGATVTCLNGHVGWIDNPVGRATVSGGSVWSSAIDLNVRGLLEVNDGGTVIADLVDVTTSGELTGNGTVLAELDARGVLRPGHPVGTLTVDGAMNLSGPLR